MRAFNQPTKDTSQTKIDFHLDNVLKASGSALKNYSMQKTIDEMRLAMHVAVTDMGEEFVRGVIAKVEKEKAEKESAEWAKLRGRAL